MEGQTGKRVGRGEEEGEETPCHVREEESNWDGAGLSTGGGGRSCRAAHVASEMHIVHFRGKGDKAPHSSQGYGPADMAPSDKLTTR